MSARLWVGPHCLENPDGLSHWSTISRIRKYCYSFPADPIPAGDTVICRADHTDYLTPFTTEDGETVKDPQTTGVDFFRSRVLPVERANRHLYQPGVTVLWELENEPDWKRDQWSTSKAVAAIRWYGQFHAAALREAARSGVRLIVGNWATQTPSHQGLSTDQLYIHYAASGVFETLRDCQGAIGFHMYDDRVTPQWYVVPHSRALRSRAGWRVPVYLTEIGVENWKAYYADKGGAEGYAVRYILPASYRCGPREDFDGAAIFTIGGGWPAFKIDGNQSREIVDVIEDIMFSQPEPDRYTVNPVKAKALNIRTAPGVERLAIAQLKFGDLVEIVDSAKSIDGGIWAAVQDFDEESRFRGWVNVAYLKRIE